MLSYRFGICSHIVQEITDNMINDACSIIGFLPYYDILQFSSSIFICALNKKLLCKARNFTSRHIA